MVSKKRNGKKKSPKVDPKIVKELKREFEDPSETEVPNLPDFSIKDEDGGTFIIKKRGKNKRGEA
jgi:hypothetical protein